MNNNFSGLMALLLLASKVCAGDIVPGQSPEVVGAKIAAIRVERVNVFDPTVPGEDWWPFRIANKIHYPTRETVIRRELLFAPGAKWDPLKVIQSERNLRANGAFRSADIFQVKRPDGLVDAVVRSQDSWTTNPLFAVGTEGGESFFGAGVEEGNILGYGKSIAVNFNRTGNKTASALSYGDPRFLGTRLAFNSGYSHGTTGDTSHASLIRPFYSLDTYSASAVSWNRSVSELVIYRDAEELSKFRRHRQVAEASLGIRLKEDRWFIQRSEMGWFADRTRYELLPLTAHGSLPEDRELSGPTASYSWIRPDYIKETDIDRMERVEDFNLGNEFSVRAGWMGTRTGSNLDRLIFNVSNQQGLRLASDRFAIGRVGLMGRTASKQWENTLASADLNFVWKTRWRGEHTLVGHIEGAFGKRLDRDGAIMLGGNTGLRGYKNNSFVGSKAVLVNFEDRFFLKGEWFHLIRLGGAVFLDSGIVGTDSIALALRNIKSDVGVGLRAASTRSRSGGIVRIDLAYALNRGPGSSRWVVSITGGQAFSLFNSSARGIDPSPPSRLN